MSNTTTSLSRKIGKAGDLQSVVRMMKTLAASSIGQYEKSVQALGDYQRTVELGLRTCLRESRPASLIAGWKRPPGKVYAVVFGSDQGLVGRFNDMVSDYAVKSLSPLSVKPEVWAVGERVYDLLTDAGLPMKGLFAVPAGVKIITSLVGKILMESETEFGHSDNAVLLLCYNQPASESIFTPVARRLLPLDETWQRTMMELPWPTTNVPEVIGGDIPTLRALIREYLFVSVYRACAESLASENASRLASMQRADNNIDELLENLTRTFHRLRQSSIDTELFDVITGFEAVAVKEKGIFY